MKTLSAVLIIIFMLWSNALLNAQDSKEQLARRLSYPVSDMVSIPFQFNWENGVGPNNDLRYLLNIQPVVPFSLSKSWNLVGRWIMPYLSQPVLASGGEPASG